MSKRQSDEERAIDRVEADLRKKVRAGLFTLTAECLGSPLLTILSGLGIDAEAKLLEIFLDETDQLLNQNQGVEHADR